MAVRSIGIPLLFKNWLVKRLWVLGDVRSLERQLSDEDV